MKDLKVTLVRQSKKINPKTNKKDRTRTVISDHIKQISFETKVKKGNEEMMMNNKPIKEENEFVFETKIFRQSEEGVSSVTSYEEIAPIKEKEEDLFKTVIHGIYNPATVEEKSEELPEKSIENKEEKYSEELPLGEGIEYIELHHKDDNIEEEQEEEYSEEDEFESDPEERDLEGYEDEEDYDEYEDDEDYLMNLVPENQKKRIKGSVDKITKRNLSEQF